MKATSIPSACPFRGERSVLATTHAKENVIASFVELHVERLMAATDDDRAYCREYNP